MNSASGEKVYPLPYPPVTEGLQRNLGQLGQLGEEQKGQAERLEGLGDVILGTYH
jgi:hypothetical protein